MMLRDYNVCIFKICFFFAVRINLNLMFCYAVKCIRVMHELPREDKIILREVKTIPPRGNEECAIRNEECRMRNEECGAKTYQE